MMLKIGDFSKISQVSVKTLRYYDEIGLLKPSTIDNFTSYRYYSFDQLPHLNRILALKELGFSLTQISQILHDGLALPELRGMLRLKLLESQQRMQDDQEMVKRIEARLEQLKQENTMPTYDIVLKKIESLPIASVRGMIPSYPEQGGLWNTLETFLTIQRITPTGACFTLYHSEEPEIDAEVCEPINPVIESQGEIKSYILPEFDTAACTVHHGPFITIGQAYEALIKWIETNGYQFAGPTREIYLNPANNGSQTDPETITEIQFPVRKG
jgi:DNA-binding transcriptional MerR regulator